LEDLEPYQAVSGGEVNAYPTLAAIEEEEAPDEATDSGLGNSGICYAVDTLRRQQEVPLILDNTLDSKAVFVRWP
jgi:hypothetical protein